MHKNILNISENITKRFGAARPLAPLLCSGYATDWHVLGSERQSPVCPTACISENDHYVPEMPLLG